MPQLDFTFSTELEFDADAVNHDFVLRCLPSDTARQRVINTQLDIAPKANIFYCTENSGNIAVHGHIENTHRLFKFTSSGRVETGLDIFEERAQRESRFAVLKYPTALTSAGEKLKKYASTLEIFDRQRPYDTVICILRRLSRDFSYEKNVTEVGTTAEQAFALGAGVCQDFSHIMLALLRLAGIPSRYVTGLLLGEGESHAWVEVLCRGWWYGIDATNDSLTDWRYIRFACGRDSADCPINKGTFYGKTNQTESVCAVVTLADPDSQVPSASQTHLQEQQE